MTPPDVSVIVPTYNERENLPLLVEQLHEHLTTNGYRYEIVVVDDDSPDETWRVAEQLTENYSVRVIRRRVETGLATAVTRGFEAAVGAQFVVMDSDLQHPPAPFRGCSRH